MLKALYDYAVRRELALPPGFVNKTVKAYISLSEQSDFLDITLGDRDAVPCPDIGSLANGTKLSNVLVEKRSVVLPEEPMAKSEYFLSALRDAAKHDPALDLCVAALEREESRADLRRRLDSAKVKPSDRIGFELDGVSILKRQSVLDWWREYRKQLPTGKGDAQARCLITGDLTVPMSTTPSIQGLRRVGGHSSGDALICFDKAAFCSYNLKQGANAPVSEEAYAPIKAALDDLLANAPILAGMKFVHWYDREIPPQEDPVYLWGDFGDFGVEDEEEPDQETDRVTEATAVRQADRLVESVYSGERDVILGDAVYHILLLSGVGGRVMIRRYEQGSYERLRVALEQWNRDLALTNLRGTQVLPACKLSARLLRLLKYQKADKKPFERANKELSGLIPAILDAILHGGPLPDSVAVRALQSIRSQILSNEEDNGQLDYGLGLACQWLKVWLIRNRGKGDDIMSVYNEENPSPAYQCGAILAVYERIQKVAYPNTNVSVVQRYYASAIQTPALVLGRLSQLSVHHLREVERGTGKGLGAYFAKLLADTYSAMDGSIPTVLTLAEQAEFALGYYQMQAKLNTKKDKEEQKNGDPESV